MPEDSHKRSRVCRRIIYTGRVQGVGFRYTTASVARRYPVLGYAKNLSDGSVELVVDGVAESVTEFLQEISATFQGHINSATSAEHATDERFDRFEIRF